MPGTCILETKRLILRPFRMEDAMAMYTNWARDPEVTRFLTWSNHNSPKDTEALLGNWISHYKEPRYYNWCIELKDLGEAIGNISIVKQDENISSAEIGYCMGKAWWGKGIMAEAATELIRYLFEKEGFNRVCAGHDAQNQKSGRVMQKIGLLYEGTLKKAGRNNTGLCDMCIYGLTKELYDKAKARS